MKATLSTLAGVLFLAPAVHAQSEVVFTIDQPATIFNGWGVASYPFSDVNADGIGDILVPVWNHGGVNVASLHSGANGELLSIMNVPFGPQFYGHAMFDIGDFTGDGISDVAVAASNSGDANSTNGYIRICSGADGSFVTEFLPPANTTIKSNFKGFSTLMDDVDGDGHDDLLLRTRLVQDQNKIAWTMFSSHTGNVLFQVESAPNPISHEYLFGMVAPRMSDHDGDGIDDFGVVRTDGITMSFDFHSGATGVYLNTVLLPGVPLLTGNGEPVVSITDMDGDGLRDLAIGGTFNGYMSIHSSATGQPTYVWDCDGFNPGCPGNRIVETGDLNGDGHPELLSVEVGVQNPTDLRLFAIDPLTGIVLHDPVMSEFVGFYTGTGRITAVPGLDESGFVRILVHDEMTGSINMRRFAPSVGEPGCPGLAPAFTTPMELRLLGSDGMADDHTVMELSDAPALSVTTILLGNQYAGPQPFVNTLCVGRAPLRYGVGQTDAEGFMSFEMGLAGFANVGETWTTQMVVRAATTQAMHFSNGIRFVVQP